MIIALKFPLVIDTETLSSFAWIKRMDILETLYSGKMSTTEIILVHEICVVQHIFKQGQNIFRIFLNSIKTMFGVYI